MNERNRTPIAALLIVNCISLVGASLTMVAIPWFVLETTGSAGKAGLSGAVAMLPGFVVGIFGGALVDRIGPRISSVVADIVAGVSILLIPIIYHTIGLQFWQLLVLVLFSSALDIPGMTARRALLPELAKLGDVRLDRVNAILEGNNTVSGFIGPPIAGILIGLIGASNVLWIDAATSLVSAVSILLFIPKGLYQRVATVSQGYIQDLKDGLRFLWREPMVRAIAVTLSATNLFGAPFFGLIFAVYAKETYDDPRYLGLMLSAFSVGMVIGAAFYGWKGYRLPRRTIMVVFLLMLTVAYWPCAFDLPFAVIIGALVLGGLFDGPINPVLVTVRLERIPFEMRGRVMASTSAISQLFPPFSIPLTGLAIEQVGISTTVLVLASAALVVGAVLALDPIWKQMDDTRPGHVASATG